MGKNKILRPNQVVDMLGLSRTTLWRLERKGLFPPRIQLGLRAVGWREADIVAWQKSREIPQ